MVFYPATPVLSSEGGTITGALTVAGLLTTQAGVSNSGAAVNSSAGITTSGLSAISSGGNLNAALGNVSTNGPIDITAAGQGLQVKEGANAKQGTAVLVAGTVTVANTAVTANSRILLTSNADGGTPGFVRVSARVAGTSFTITSSSGTDTSTIAYEIFEPG